jgi:hypothetical protein
MIGSSSSRLQAIGAGVESSEGMRAGKQENNGVVRYQLVKTGMGIVEGIKS